MFKSESEFESAVHRVIQSRRCLLFFHLTRPQKLGKGFPDLVIAGPGGVLYRELKMPGGSLSPEQVSWKWTLLTSGQNWAVWQPADLESGKIERELARLAEP